MTQAPKFDVEAYLRDHEMALAYIVELRAENKRLQKIEIAARALKFSACPAHGPGFVIQVSGGSINDLEAALAAE
jgi:hypothetical protein